MLGAKRNDGAVTTFETKRGSLSPIGNRVARAMEAGRHGIRVTARERIRVDHLSALTGHR